MKNFLNPVRLYVKQNFCENSFRNDGKVKSIRGGKGGGNRSKGKFEKNFFFFYFKSLKSTTQKVTKLEILKWG